MGRLKMTKDEALKMAIEGFKVLGLGVLACVSITTAFALIVVWLKLTCKFLEYVWTIA